MWNILPNDIKREIIKLNPSLKKIHSENLEPCLKSIRLLRHSRMCVECSRESIFGEDNYIYRKPSVKMYYKLENLNQNARVSCSCNEHALLEYNQGRILIKNGMEMDYLHLFKFIKESHNISSLICYTGLDESDLDVLLGDQDDTIPAPVVRWDRLVFITSDL